MSRHLARALSSRQLDVVEWSLQNRADLKKLAALRYSEEKGLLGYCKDAVGFVTDYHKGKQEKKEKAKAEKALRVRAEEKGITVEELKKIEGIAEETKKKNENEIDTVAQYYTSQDLLKRMKWKRVTWDAKADYESFARRIQDNDTVFSKVPAFSFMCLHLVHDTRNARITDLAPNSTDYERGSITKWALEERIELKAPEPFILSSQQPGAKDTPKGGAYTMDWEAGEARLSDSITAHEMHLFLQTVAPRLQAVQVRMDDEQQRITEDLEQCRVRLGVNAIKINKYDRAVWDDPQRKADPENYVTPAEVIEFIDSVFKRGYLLRRCLKGQQVRLVRAGQPYKIDFETKEVHVPSNFADFNHLPLHRRYELLERFFNAQRKIWWFWFAMGVLFVGDFEMV